MTYCEKGITITIFFEIIIHQTLFIMRNTIIFLGIVLIFGCFGLVIYNDIADLTASAMNFNTWLANGLGLTGVAMILISLVRKPSYLCRRSINGYW